MASYIIIDDDVDKRYICHLEDSDLKGVGKELKRFIKEVIIPKFIIDSDNFVNLLKNKQNLYKEVSNFSPTASDFLYKVELFTDQVKISVRTFKMSDSGDLKDNLVPEFTEIFKYGNVY